MDEKMSSNNEVKRMADILRSGATMLFEQCPECNSPLFKIRDEVWCTRCDKKIIFVKEEEDITKATMSLILNDVEKTLLLKVQECEIQEIGNLLYLWLEALDRINRIRIG
jgi:uncharacterized Zn finger protein (UPF0148 family)